MKLMGGVILSLVGLYASAGSFTESFNSTSLRNTTTTTLHWNIGRGILHPTQTMANWKPFTAGLRSTTLNFGTGTHGAFVPATYNTFDSDGDFTNTTIAINTTLYPELNVTNFELAAGYTLLPVGSNPLIIRSLSDVSLAATSIIECSGPNGQATQNPENSTTSTSQGRCGGGNGGAGGRHDGAVFTASERGTPQSGAGIALAGFGGADGTFGGGGGGSFYNAALPAGGRNPASVVVGGTAGTTVDNQDFSVLLGGAGGGGGGAFYAGAPADPTSSTGGGGGAGGGVVIIYAQRDFLNSGSIRARGGNGGGVTAAQLGGLGGGGGGGTVIIIAGRNYQNDGTVTVAAGSGATRGGNAGNGGNGGSGRAWYTDNDGVLAGTGSEDTSCILEFCGSSEYDIGTLVAESTSIDLQNTRPTPQSLQVTSTVTGAGSVSVQVAGSKDNFSSDNSGWVSSGSLSQLSNKRYFRFRVSIDNQVAANPTFVDALTLTYEETTLSDFAFSSGCSGSGNQSAGFLLDQFFWQWITFLSPYFFMRATRRRRDDEH